MANLSNLKIYINPISAAAPATATQIANYGTLDGYMLFDEKGQLIYVNGKGYGLSVTGAASLTKVINDVATLNNGATSAEGSVANKIYQITGDTSNLNIGGVTGASIATYLTQLQSEYSALSGTVAAMQTDIQGGYIAQSKGEGETNYTTANAIATDIASAITGAAAAVATGVATAKSYADSLAPNYDAAGTATGAYQQLVGNGSVGATGVWGVGEAQTLSHLKEILNTIQGGSNVDLSTLASQVAAINKELEDGSGTGLDTLLDGLKVVLGNTLSATGAYYTVGETTNIQTLQGIIEALEGAITANSTADQSYAAGQATSAKNDAIAASVTGVAAAKKELIGATGASAYDVSIYGALNAASAAKAAADAAAAAATAAASSHSTVTASGVTGASKEYITVTSATVDGHTQYTVQTTTALDEAIASAAATAAGNIITWETI